MKHKNIRQNGGNITDNDFVNCYEVNLRKIQNAIQTYSGKHTINMDKAREFIENQTSPIRQEAAKHLVDNTIYITLQEVFDIVGKLIDKVYSQIGDAASALITEKIERQQFFFERLKNNVNWQLFLR